MKQLLRSNGAAALVFLMFFTAQAATHPPPYDAHATVEVATVQAIEVIPTHPTQ